MTAARWRNCGKKSTAGLMLLLLCFVWPAFADGLVRVTEVPTAKTLRLEDGRIVRLAALQAPNIARHAKERDEPLAHEALARLEALTLGRELRLTPVGAGTDRHGRLVAWARDAEGRSIQEEMLRAGMAWVYTFPDTREEAASLLAAEAEGEKARRGIWAEPAYAVLTPETASRHLGEFRLVEGTVQQLGKTRDRWYLNFGEDWRTDFTLIIERKNLRHFDPAWLEGLAGRQVRVRGWLFGMNGPAMELTHPEQMELK